MNRNSRLNPIWILRSDYGNEDGLCTSMIVKKAPYENLARYDEADALLQTLNRVYGEKDEI